jgi:hypothetical protein
VEVDVEAFVDGLGKGGQGGREDVEESRRFAVVERKALRRPWSREVRVGHGRGDDEAGLGELEIDEVVAAPLQPLRHHDRHGKIDYDSATDLRKQHGVTIESTFVRVDPAGERVKLWSGYGKDKSVDAILENTK